MHRPLTLQSAIGLLIAASSHAAAADLPAFQIHTQNPVSASGIEALASGPAGLAQAAPSAWNGDLLLGLLEHDASQPDPAALAEADRLHQSDQSSGTLDSPIHAASATVMTYTATNLASPAHRQMIDPADLTPRSLNTERYAPTKSTLAIFIPSLGTPALLAAGLLTATRRRR